MDSFLTIIFATMFSLVVGFAVGFNWGYSDQMAKAYGERAFEVLRENQSGY